MSANYDHADGSPFFTYCAGTSIKMISESFTSVIKISGSFISAESPWSSFSSLTWIEPVIAYK
jgi:hypothetical protein